MRSLFHGHEKGSGLYRIRNEVNGRRYLGTASLFRNRFYDHVRKLKRGVHFNAPLQEDFDQFGEGVFTFEVIALILDPEERLRAEEETIRRIFGPSCYNLASDCPFYPLGIKHSEESRRKQSERQKGRKLSDETKEKIRASLTGRKTSPSTRKKQSETHKGLFRSDQTRQKLSEALKGRLFSSTHRERLSVSNSGKKASPETRSKMSAAHMGNRYAAGNLGRVQSPEHVSRRVAARLATLEARKSLSAPGF